VGLDSPVPGETCFAPMKYALHFMGQAFHRAGKPGNDVVGLDFGFCILVFELLMGNGIPHYGDAVYYHRFFRPVIEACFYRSDFFHHIHPGDDLSEDRMFVIQVRRRGKGDEKLASVSIRSGVGHG